MFFFTSCKGFYEKCKKKSMLRGHFQQVPIYFSVILLPLEPAFFDLVGRTFCLEGSLRSETWSASVTDPWSVEQAFSTTSHLLPFTSVLNFPKSGTAELSFTFKNKLYSSSAKKRTIKIHKSKYNHGDRFLANTT